MYLLIEIDLSYEVIRRCAKNRNEIRVRVASYTNRGVIGSAESPSLPLEACRLRDFCNL